ncbi:hypothetical protein DelCs14_2679 [Delftia sp. Cs1-4]|uniref:TIR domain-containing protein n=1 Tax=Delftia sp. (strain Cs1-4) TaxID=742013 RepID=UPI00020E8285|nr:TIR domain-containing protein [Delftia sp. Cs1-4]AEF89691.1 hypothetical protein DelCs14_2679 [Delftia sp. Cs1-4]
MNVFLSWSGERSRLVAEALKPWLKCVLQTTTPWISTTDIDRGSIWMNEIGNKLQDSTIGIICLTAENQKNPWILFESGALAKGLASNRVCTLLIDLQPSNISGPLAQFNHTPFDRDNMLKLIFGINSKLSIPVDPETLNTTFDAFWPTIQKDIEGILQRTKDAPPIAPPTEGDMLKDIATSLGILMSRMGGLENKLQSIQPSRSAWHSEIDNEEMDLLIQKRRAEIAAQEAAIKMEQEVIRQEDIIQRAQQAANRISLAEEHARRAARLTSALPPRKK